MVEDIVLDIFPKKAGVYLFKIDNEVIYVGSSKNLYQRMIKHRSYIRKGGAHGYKQDLYKYIQSNHFSVEFQLTDDYRQLEQELIEQHHPKYNAIRAYTGVVWNGNKAEYNKKYNEKYQYNKQYDNQLCLYEGQILTLNALRKRLRRQGISNPTQEAIKYSLKKESTPIEFYDVYP